MTQDLLLRLTCFYQSFFQQRAMLGHEIEGENQLLELPTGTHLQLNIFA